jgi:hypothetical protein
MWLFEVLLDQDPPKGRGSTREVRVAKGMPL